jgi:hypothetical protein
MAAVTHSRQVLRWEGTMGVAVTVRFASRLIPGVPKEQVFPWDEDCGGVVRFDEDAIRLSGKRRMSVASDVLTIGPLQPLVKRTLAKDLSVVIPIADLEHVTFNRDRGVFGNDLVRFNVYQRLPDGNRAVHVFVAGLYKVKNGPTLDQVVAGMQAVVPAAIVTQEGSQAVPSQALPAAEWYPDPMGRHQFRYWNGAEWTESVADDGAQSADPMPASS